MEWMSDKSCRILLASVIWQACADLNLNDTRLRKEANLWLHSKTSQGHFATLGINQKKFLTELKKKRLYKEAKAQKRSRIPVVGTTIAADVHDVPKS